jgi:hypothetical protein
MQSWRQNVAVVLLIVFVCSGTVLAQEDGTSDLLQDYLDRAGGDVSVALELAVRDNVWLVGNSENLEHDLAYEAAKIKRLEDDLDSVEPTFLEKIGNSTVFKVALMFGAFKLGVESR